MYVLIKNKLVLIKQMQPCKQSEEMGLQKLCHDAKLHRNGRSIHLPYIKARLREPCCREDGLMVLMGLRQ